MVYKISDILRDVRIAIDENATSDTLVNLSDIDALTLDEIIRSKIEDGVRMVCLAAPVVMLGSGDTFVETIGWHKEIGIGSGRVILPKDFLRLITFKMSDWSHAVNTPISEDDPLYLVQTSKFKGVKGTPEMPVVALVQYADGLSLEFYSCKAGKDVELQRARYLKDPKITTNNGVDGIEIPQLLERACIYYIASLATTEVGAAEKATSLQETAKQFMS